MLFNAEPLLFVFDITPDFNTLPEQIVDSPRDSDALVLLPSTSTTVFPFQSSSNFSNEEVHFPRRPCVRAEREWNEVQELWPDHG